jgi:hypothetical protein
LKTKPTTIRASATLTGSLVASSTVDCRSASIVTLEVQYTSGTGGSGLQLHPEVSHDNTTWVPAATALTAGTPSSGTVTMAMEDPTYTLTVTGNRVLHLDVYGMRHFRVRALEAGSPSPFGQLTLVASTWEQ